MGYAAYLRDSSFTLCATHYSQLADLESVYPNAKNYHLEVEHDPTKLQPKYMYILKEGPTDLKFGLVLAEIAGLPADAIAAAKEIQRKLLATERSKQEREVQRSRALNQLIQRLVNLKTSTLSPGIFTILDGCWCLSH